MAQISWEEKDSDRTEANRERAIDGNDEGEKDLLTHVALRFVELNFALDLAQK